MGSLAIERPFCVSPGVEPTSFTISEELYTMSANMLAPSRTSERRAQVDATDVILTALDVPSWHASTHT